MVVCLPSVAKSESVGGVYSKPESLIRNAFISLLFPLIDIDIIIGGDKTVKVPWENDGVKCNLVGILWIEYNLRYIIWKRVRAILRIQGL